MKKLAILVAIATAAASSAFAQQPAVAAAEQVAASKPVPMTDEQMDKVTAGALLNVALVDVVDVRNVNVQVAIPVNAAVAIGVLGGAVGTAVQRPGRQVAF